MTHEEFDKMFDSRIEKLRETGKTKGRKYTKGADDRLANFKGCVGGVTPFQVWEVFFRKHWTSIEHYLKTGENIGEDICDTHIHDCIMYLFLLEGLIREQNDQTIPYRAECGHCIYLVPKWIEKKAFCAVCRRDVYVEKI